MGGRFWGRDRLLENAQKISTKAKKQKNCCGTPKRNKFNNFTLGSAFGVARLLNKIGFKRCKCVCVCVP